MKKSLLFFKNRRLFFERALWGLRSCGFRHPVKDSKKRKHKERTVGMFWQSFLFLRRFSEFGFFVADSFIPFDLIIWLKSNQNDLP